MAGIDDNIALVGDWSSSNPSPRTFFSKFLGDDFLSENADSVPLLESDKQKTSVDIVDRDGDVAFDPSDYTFADFKPNNVFGIPKPQSRGGLADRMATRAGFSALKINTARIRSENMGSSSPDARSPCVTIPPGLSPTTLLDSPVFLFNNLIQPSPTTGKFLLGQCTTTASTLISESSDKSKDPSISDVDTEPFAFKPHLESSPTNFAFGANQVDANVHKQQPVPIIEDSVQPQYLNRTVSLDAMVGHPQNPEEVHIQTMFRESSERKDVCNDAVCNQKSSSPALENEDSPPPTDQPEGDELKVDLASSVLGQPSEDGYNWRKYGQKQVKGSEYPRSYYKCTHPNCQVKKKVEQSPEGQVTEIIYKGTHVHPKPPPNRRAAIPSSHPYGEAQIDSSENPDLPPSAEVRPLWSTVPNGSASSDWRNDTLDTQSSISVAAEFCDPSNSEHTQDGPHFESAGAVDVSSQLSNDDEGEQATHGSVSRGGDGEEDESEFKRRKLDNSVLDMSAASRAVREPRVVVQTTSEVDILDDGYRWRKYGQKVVKGNPNPRSYYKCTSAGCTVRKHVERASHDLQSVITTYEGKHNHEVPAARNSSHASSVPSGAAASASQSHGIPRRPEASQMQESYSNFNTQSALGALGMHGREHLVPRAGFSFGLGQPGLTNLAMAGLGPSLPGKMHPPMHHPYLGQPPMSEAGSGFVIPKGELEDETMTDSGLPMPNSSAVYQQMMGRLPLGHQM